MQWQFGFSASVLLASTDALANERTAVAELRTFIAVPVEERFEAASSAGDLRFLGVYSYTLEVPGVPQAQADLTSDRGVLAIPGTSDALVSEEHGALNVRARAYAERYNALLIRHLGQAAP